MVSRMYVQGRMPTRGSQKRMSLNADLREVGDVAVEVVDHAQGRQCTAAHQQRKVTMNNRSSDQNPVLTKLQGHDHGIVGGVDAGGAKTEVVLLGQEGN